MHAAATPINVSPVLAQECRVTAGLREAGASDAFSASRIDGWKSGGETGFAESSSEGRERPAVAMGRVLGWCGHAAVGVWKRGDRLLSAKWWVIL